MPSSTPHQGTARGPALTARGLVAGRVARRARRFPEVFPEPLVTDGLSSRDAALAHAIDQAVARRWLTLVAVLSSRLDRPWPRLQPEVQAALLTGSAQLLLLDRLPDHAVINESVAWVKRRSLAAARFVNAVLHRVADLRQQRVGGEGRPAAGRDELLLHDGRVFELVEPVFADDPLERLAQQTSHPAPLLARWIERLGQARAVELARHSLVRPPIILTGVPAEPGAGLGAFTLAPHEEAGFAVFEGTHAGLEALLAQVPGLHVQDPATAAAVASTKDLVPQLIVEVCAGKGTKTRQLAALHPQARIVASDPDPRRMQTLRAVFAGHDRVTPVEPDRLIEHAGEADLVVVDPPCSNTAVLARRVEAKYRFGPRSLAKLVDLQRQIVADALRLVAPSSHLLYSTCSLEPEENEQQMQWIGRWHPLRLRRQDGRLPRAVPGDPPSRYADGCFHALMRRQ